MFEDIAADEVNDVDVNVQGVEAAPIVRLVDVVLADAVRARASDVHVEPQAGELRIRYRVDGLLRDVMTVPEERHLRRGQPASRSCPGSTSPSAAARRTAAPSSPSTG